jgi:hypothetical protein
MRYEEKSSREIPEAPKAVLEVARGFPFPKHTIKFNLAVSNFQGFVIIRNYYISEF